MWEKHDSESDRSDCEYAYIIIRIYNVYYIYTYYIYTYYIYKIIIYIYTYYIYTSYIYKIIIYIYTYIIYIYIYLSVKVQ